MEKENKYYDSKRKARLIIMVFIRVILFLVFIWALFEDRRLILFTSIFAFLLTFIPYISYRYFKINIPAHFEVTLILFIYGLLYFWKVRGFYFDFKILSVMLSVLASVALGLVGLTIMHSLYRAHKIKGNPLFISFFSFCFALSMGAIMESAEFLADILFGFNLQKAGFFGTGGDLLAYFGGALVVSILGYSYIKRGKLTLISSVVENIMRKNLKNVEMEDSDEHIDKIKGLLKNGESSKMEFKSTLRTNIHTNQPDKKMEHSVLKTITAYLNSAGGSLLVGVSDKGEIIGLDKDNFSNDDNMHRHFSSLVRDYIGGEFLHLIKSRVVEMDGKKILKIECDKSDKAVFLKASDGLEEFYVRNGASSVPLTGSSLVNYINSFFKGG